VDVRKKNARRRNFPGGPTGRHPSQLSKRKEREVLALWNKGMKARAISEILGISYDRVRAIYRRLTETPEEREIRLHGPLKLPSPKKKALLEAREREQSEGWEGRLSEARERKREANEALKRRQIKRFILLCEEADNHTRNRVWVRVDGRLRTKRGGYHTIHNPVFSDDRALTEVREDYSRRV